MLRFVSVELPAKAWSKF